GDTIVGLFNTTTSTQVVSTTPAAVGLSAADGYRLDELWTRAATGTGGAIAANVPAHGVALFRVRPSATAALLPPSVTLAVDGLDALTAGGPSTVTTTFTNNGLRPVQRIETRLSTPDGWV